jgi:N-acetyl-gamma-glutamyl-phosphate reductase
MGKVRAGIAGFRGYSGNELIRILEHHPAVTDLLLLDHRSDAGDRPQPIGAKSHRRTACSGESVREEQLDCVFLATPPEVSMELAPALLDAGTKVIDLSGAFRLGNADKYLRWYKETHTAPDLLKEAVYGLPEVNRTKLAKAVLVANPGCYPTAANLAIQPLLDRGVVDLRAGVVCDAKSGASGAGRRPSLKTSFCEVTENFNAYAVLDHRHVPEILMISGIEEADLSFTAQLLPIDRGILETIYFRARGLTRVEDLLDVYLRRYQGEYFVRIYKPGELPDLRSVQHTNFCDIGFKFDPATGRAVVVSVIDNLVKGAAGQAVQNMNLMFGLRETDGLL